MMGKAGVDLKTRKENGFNSERSYIIYKLVMCLGRTGDG